MVQQAGVTPRNPHQRWQFAVEIEGFDAGFFTTCSGVQTEHEVSRFSPGGSIFDQKVVGRTNFPPITLEKGKAQESLDNSVIQWLRQILQAAQGTGGLPTDYLRPLDIVEFDRQGNEIRRFRLFNAFVQQANLGEYDGSSSEVTIENMTVEFQFFDQVA